MTGDKHFVNLCLHNDTRDAKDSIIALNIHNENLGRCRNGEKLFIFLLRGLKTINLKQIGLFEHNILQHFK